MKRNIVIAAALVLCISGTVWAGCTDVISGILDYSVIWSPSYEVCWSVYVHENNARYKINAGFDLNPYKYQAVWLYGGIVQPCYTFSNCTFDACFNACAASLEECSLDEYEGDIPEILDGEIQQHNLCNDQADWVKFNVCEGVEYTISISNVGANSDTVLELYYPTQVLLHSSNYDFNPSIQFSPDNDGIVYVKMKPSDVSNTGAYTEYFVTMSGFNEICGFGSVPDGYFVPGDPLTLVKEGNDIKLMYSSVQDAVGYFVYRGNVGEWYSHNENMAYPACNENAALYSYDYSAVLDSNDYYYVVTASSGSCESTTGYDSTGNKREVSGFWPSESCNMLCP